MKAANVSQITETILSLELAINERWNKGDVDGALEMYSEDVTYFDPLTATRLDGVNIVPDGQGGEKQGTPWNSTQVYRLIDGRWRVVHVNWSFTRHPAAMQGLMS